MKTLKLYWLRFFSETPKALKKLMVFFGSISMTCFTITGMIAIYGTATNWKEGLLKVGMITAGLAAGLKFATTDANLQAGKLPTDTDSQ
ncbi:MAG: hypothetical protein ACOYMF_06200 [Bacteroidales bacterium]